MGLPQPVITRQMVLSELIKAGINQEIAEDLSYRYYKNELTHKDIEYLKENFDIKLEKVQDSLKADIEKVESNLKFEIEKVDAGLKAEIKELDNKIDTKFTELDNKIDTKFTELDNKIDNIENNLNNKIENVRTELKSDIASVSNEVALVRKDMEINKMELNSQLIKITSKLESSSKLHYWMFGTVITLFVGTLLTLIPIVYSILNK
ncbi:Bdr family repetitive protein [Borrelia miyamotoi]|uniref:Bdr family repetitive protein n=3 Tax=Borrelia miyamotoi TaxID=47466 RepID=A0AAQ3CM82_9SPIR|nr:Bdr family repetitive protein [Borrelia miyamotoi]WDS47548.1 Bdr family repetitive protein [Borrelia miyamotoi]WEG86230.1 Bdr family repetitive protein [Borrelia miyamotoi]